MCNWALERNVALAALEKLAAMGVAVLGGDVYKISGSDIKSTYDSWSCNRDDGEFEGDFVERSIAKAKSYVSSYQAGAEDVFFAIVPLIKE